MPAYNAERSIADAVAGALGQTVSDLEVVVVDDGSARPAAAALESVRDERLRILRSVANRGVSAARNSALAAARAPVVAQLDADDLWKETHLEGVLGELDDPSVGLAYTNAEVIGHPRGARLWIPSRDSRELAVQGPGVSHPVNDLDTLYRGNPIPAPAVVMRTHAARAGGLSGVAEGRGGLPALHPPAAGRLEVRVCRPCIGGVSLARAGAGGDLRPPPARASGAQAADRAARGIAHDPVLRAQLPRHLREIVETHVPGSVWIARNVRRMLSVGSEPADKI